MVKKGKKSKEMETCGKKVKEVKENKVNWKFWGKERENLLQKKETYDEN